MEKQSTFEIFIYLIVGAVFFAGYYFLTKDVIGADPLSGGTLFFTIYFLLAILAFPKSGQFLSEKIQVNGINSKVIMPLAFIAGPIIFIAGVISGGEKE